MPRSFDKLKLQHRAALVAEGALRRGELIFPDPAEALAMNRPRFVAICRKRARQCSSVNA